MSSLSKTLEQEQGYMAELMTKVQEQQLRIAELEQSIQIEELQSNLNTLLYKIQKRFERVRELRFIITKYPLATESSESVTIIEFMDPTFGFQFRAQFKDFPRQPFELESKLKTVYYTFYQEFSKLYADFYFKMHRSISHPAFREHRLDCMINFDPDELLFLKECYLRVTQFESRELLQLHEEFVDPGPFLDLVSKYKIYDESRPLDNFTDMTFIYISYPQNLHHTMKRIYSDFCYKVFEHFGSNRIELIGDIEFTAEELQLLKLYKFHVEHVNVLRRAHDQ